MNRLALALCIALLPSPALADSVVVGSGTAASCSTAAYNAAMQVLVDGPQGRGGVLTFRCGSQPHTITMNREWGLTDEVLIDGAGLITLDGQNLHRFYQSYLLIEGRTEVTLRDIRLIRGFAASDFGGAVYVRQGTSMTLDGVTVADCRAATSGGAIAADAMTQLSITGSVFLNNRAGDGGALAIRAATQISDSVFSGNRAEAGNAEGGAIQSYEQSLTIANTVFQDNVSAWSGGAILKRNATLSLDGVSILRNTAPRDGAGVYTDASTSLQADRVKVIGNIGDGMYVAGGLVLRRGSFHDNRNNGIAKTALAMNSGNAALLIEKSTFGGNDNAIFLQRDSDATGIAGTLRLDNVTMHDSRFSAIGILDFPDRLNVEIDQSSLVEPTVSPLQSFRGRITYSASMIISGANQGCITLSSPPSAFISGGNNLVGPGCPRSGSDAAVQTLAELQLSALEDHGGDVKTLLPAATSPAIDRRSCINLDARDRPRPVDADQNGSVLCDIGAVERQLVELTDALFEDGFDPVMPRPGD
jgi:hypothetical protein